MSLQEEIKKINEKIEALNKDMQSLMSELDAGVENEFPMCDDAYWYMTTTGKIFNSNWDGFVSEEYMLEIGNVFQTEEQAEFAVGKLKIEAELRKFSRPFTWIEKNWFLTMDSDKDILIEYGDYGAYQGTIYFESKEKAIEAIESVGKERIKKYIFGVED